MREADCQDIASLSAADTHVTLTAFGFTARHLHASVTQQLEQNPELPVTR